MQNKMRNRLINLIDDIVDCNSGEFADYLLKNGVIVPPCKVGDRLYQIYEVANHRFISDFPETVEPYQVVYKNIMGNYSGIPFEEIGKTVFLTKEDAEQELQKGGADNG